MKPHIVSDLHTEFSGLYPPETDAEAVVLAGDIGDCQGRSMANVKLENLARIRQLKALIRDADLIASKLHNQG